MSVFEAIMLVCFGVSWPISIAKSLRTKKVEGKSPLFMGIVCFGYLNGVLYKTLHAFDWIIVLYALNMVVVATDLLLYFYYTRPRRGGLPEDWSEGSPGKCAV